MVVVVSIFCDEVVVSSGSDAVVVVDEVVVEAIVVVDVVVVEGRGEVSGKHVEGSPAIQFPEAPSKIVFGGHCCNDPMKNMQT